MFEGPFWLDFVFKRIASSHTKKLPKGMCKEGPIYVPFLEFCIFDNSLVFFKLT